MTEREVLQLALEALEVNLGTWSAKKKAIPAIKEVLAQPEPSELDIWKSRALQAEAVVEKFMAQPEQEPVAWRWGVPKLKNGDFEWRYSLNQTRPDAIPLYTTPPQRTWVGLTGFEQKELMAMSARDAVFATEVKLKEKNT